MIVKKERTYIPVDFEVNWETIEPLLLELKSRGNSTGPDLELWLKNRSELEAALEENFAWRYIRMTCDTTNE
ncbi:MAG: M3 family oligoendopeptidase, partial [Pyrinomonadaceae bacterium]|nr:M3 family oligoendopeptidase [Sphingobacteriaceae bacterium]